MSQKSEPVAREKSRSSGKRSSRNVNKEEADGRGDASAKAPAPKKEKGIKLVVRKLPVREFGLEELKASLDRVCTHLHIPQDSVFVGSFIEGKVR